MPLLVRSLGEKLREVERECEALRARVAELETRLGCATRFMWTHKGYEYRVETDMSGAYCSRTDEELNKKHLAFNGRWYKERGSFFHFPCDLLKLLDKLGLWRSTGGE